MLSSLLDLSLVFDDTLRLFLDLGSSVLDFGSSTAVTPPVEEVPDTPAA